MSTPDRPLTMEPMTLDELTPDDMNANAGTERGAAMLQASLQSYGAGRSVLVDRNGKVIAGNKTVQAAVDAGMLQAIRVRTTGEQLVVVQREDLNMDTDPEARALAVADNRTGETGLSWDAAALSAYADFGVDLTGFWTPDELEALGLTLEPVPPDAADLAYTDDHAVDSSLADQLQELWGTLPGQTWEIPSLSRPGLRHRITCGALTDAETFRFCDEETLVMTVTAIDLTLNRTDNDPIAFLMHLSTAIQRVAPGDLYALLTPFSWPAWGDMTHALTLTGWRHDSTVAWLFDDPKPGGTARLKQGYEPIFYGWPVDGLSSAAAFGRDPDETAWNIPLPKRSWGTYPVALIARCIQQSSRPGDSIFAPVGGDGVALEAAELLQRQAYLIADNSQTLALILQRAADLGLVPSLEARRSYV